MLYAIFTLEIQRRFKNGKRNLSVTRSVQIMILCYLCGYSAGAMTTLIAEFLIEDTYAAAIIKMFNVTFARLNRCAPFFIFYRYSKLYRQEILTTLSVIKNGTRPKISGTQTQTRKKFRVSDFFTRTRHRTA
ncbi:hypothetical protein L596_019365 [Steinernema carpocapsae]|uniref:G-protein coupled receptors family 1 profile domain-containing protein n=1 Tax=Steinernema carpocapsae TaxID=34508 RepID=A0A4U5MQ98_STECR|nr:hypothetical protein L596_019365 [Steinernema carpocapsae]